MTAETKAKPKRLENGTGNNKEKLRERHKVPQRGKIQRTVKENGNDGHKVGKADERANENMQGAEASYAVVVPAQSN